MHRLIPLVGLLSIAGCDAASTGPQGSNPGAVWWAPLGPSTANGEGSGFQAMIPGVEAPITLVRNPDDRWLDDFAGGAAILDCDGDLDADLYVTNQGGANHLYRNDRGRFVELDAGQAGLSDAISAGASTADYDGDGDPDLYVTVQFESNRLLRNDGDCRFEDVTDEAGLSDPWRSIHSYWADIDRDGDLDLYVTNWAGARPEGDREAPVPHPDQLWVNQGDGTFADRSDVLPEETARSFGMTGAFIDFDDDGDFDLFQVNDRGAHMVPNRMYRNDARPGALPEFTEVTDQYGLNADPDGMGLLVADFDLDGQADFFTTGNFESLFLRRGSRYVDSALSLGFPFEGGALLSWGGVAADWDVDGDEDIFYVDSRFFDGGFEDTAPYRGEAFHYVNQWPDALQFERKELRAVLGGREHWRANTATDFDGDGIPDLYLGTVERAPILALADPPDRPRGIEVRLQGRTSNTEGRGAVVRMTVGDRVMTRWPGAATPFSCGTPTWMWFGVDAEKADRIDILWPSGIEQTRFDVPAGVRIHLEEPHPQE